MSQRLGSGMGKAALTLALVAAAMAAARAQQAPSMQDGPINPGSANTGSAGSGSASTGSVDAAALPRPFTDGSYPMGPGLTAPKIVQAVPAVYPADVPAEGVRAVSLLSMVVGADGVPINLHVVHSAGDAADAAAVDAVERSKFEAGSLADGNRQQPVAVRAVVRVVFSADHSPAVPALLQRKYRSPEGNSFDYPPSPTHTAEAIFSDEARRKKISGMVVVSTLVTLDGLPSDTRVERSLGYGLDEKAIQAVDQYRFRPASKDGKPIATRISVEVSFRIY